MRGAGATACSTRSSRSLTPLQPDETRSTSSARSSMRACRSARTSPSSRSSRRITWLSRPRTSARVRPTGSTSVRRPSCTAALTFSGSVPSSSAAAAASDSTWMRVRSSAASSSAGATRPDAASAIRAFARSSVFSSTGRRLRWPSDGHLRARLRPALGADRPASARAPRRFSPPRLRPFDGRRPASRVRRAAGRALGRARRRQRHASRAGADPDRAAEGRGAPARAPLDRGDGEWLALARPTRRLKAGGRATSWGSATRRGSCA